MNNDLSELADFLHRVALDYDARARDAGTNERNRTVWMMAAEAARRHEAVVRLRLAKRRSAWVTHADASSSEDEDDE